MILVQMGALLYDDEKRRDNGCCTNATALHEYEKITEGQKKWKRSIYNSRITKRERERKISEPNGVAEQNEKKKFNNWTKERKERDIYERTKRKNSITERRKGKREKYLWENEKRTGTNDNNTVRGPILEVQKS